MSAKDTHILCVWFAQRKEMQWLLFIQAAMGYLKADKVTKKTSLKACIFPTFRSLLLLVLPSFVLSFTAMHSKHELGIKLKFTCRKQSVQVRHPLFKDLCNILCVWLSLMKMACF